MTLAWSQSESHSAHDRIRFQTRRSERHRQPYGHSQPSAARLRVCLGLRSLLGCAPDTRRIMEIRRAMIPQHHSHTATLSIAQPVGPGGAIAIVDSSPRSSTVATATQTESFSGIWFPLRRRCRYHSQGMRRCRRRCPQHRSQPLAAMLLLLSSYTRGHWFLGTLLGTTS